jgi:hypothetical protein
MHLAQSPNAERLVLRIGVINQKQRKCVAVELLCETSQQQCIDGRIMAVRKTKAGASLKRWFKEDWKDVRTGKACGRSKGEKRGTPYCRPSKRVSSKTPKTSKEMTAAEKRSRISQKKRLGQPAGKPRRVKSLKRKKK